MEVYTASSPEAVLKPQLVRSELADRIQKLAMDNAASTSASDRPQDTALPDQWSRDD